jgi:hypothetical protein
MARGGDMMQDYPTYNTDMRITTSIFLNKIRIQI